MAEATKPIVNLTNCNGNALSLLTRASQALKQEAGWTQDQIAEFYKEATSGDYDHVLQTIMKHCDVI